MAYNSQGGKSGKSKSLYSLTRAPNLMSNSDGKGHLFDLTQDHLRRRPPSRTLQDHLRLGSDQDQLRQKDQTMLKLPTPLHPQPTSISLRPKAAVGLLHNLVALQYHLTDSLLLPYGMQQGLHLEEPELEGLLRDHRCIMAAHLQISKAGATRLVVRPNMLPEVILGYGPTSCKCR